MCLGKTLHAIDDSDDDGDSNDEYDDDASVTTMKNLKAEWGQRRRKENGCSCFSFVAQEEVRVKAF